MKKIKGAMAPKKKGQAKAGPPKRKQKSGYMKAKAAGKNLVLLGLAPEIFERIARAAAKEMRPVTQFITFYAAQAAEKVLS